jgi:hypothetical protein
MQRNNWVNFLREQAQTDCNTTRLLSGLLAASSEETNLRRNDFPKSFVPMEEQATFDTEGKGINLRWLGTI